MCGAVRRLCVSRVSFAYFSCANNSSALSRRRVVPPVLVLVRSGFRRLFRANTMLPVDIEEQSMLLIVETLALRISGVVYRTQMQVER